MKFGWKLFRLACFVQMLIAVMYGFLSLINTFREGDVNYFIQAIAFFFITWFAVFSVQTLNEHYPDIPVGGKTKSVFNWLFLINFLLLAFLFGLWIREYQTLEAMAAVIKQPFLKIPGKWFSDLVFQTAMVLLQILMLYGMYSLRILLHRNFNKKTFEFEEQAAR